VSEVIVKHLHINNYIMGFIIEGVE